MVPRTGLEPVQALHSKDFKSFASTYSATPAHREELEAAPGFEPGHRGFADHCLTTWLCRPHADNNTRSNST